MRTERLLSRIKLLRREIAEQLQRVTDPKVKYELGEQLQQKTLLLILLADEELTRLGRELAKERLKSHYKHTA